MSYEYGFADNVEYGAEDLNKLVSSLVSSGVADPFTDGEAYNAKKLNEIISGVYTGGVVPDSINTLKVSHVSDGKIAIAPGLAFFEDGSTIRITEAHTMDYVPGVINYVYLKQDLAEKNYNYPVCSTEKPAYNADVVMLAEISEIKAITDKREYACGRVPGYQSNANVSMEKDIMLQVNLDTAGHSGTRTFTIDMETNNYSRVFVLSRKSNGSGDCMGMYTFADDSYYGFHFIQNKTSGSSHENLVVASEHNGGFSWPATVKFSLDGSKLKLNYSWTVESRLDGLLNFPIKVILC
ncbi:MAG: hypothetical protein IKW59_09150 [Clostridia bacterium]|nr:hypothetical protein [Clostridia bacterium]